MRRMLINDVQIIMILHQPLCVKQLSNQAVVRTRRFGQEFIFKQIHLTGLFRWGGLGRSR